jgi:type I restriction enzyme M protein
MAVKKSELYSSIWASCDILRGGMDASQYKDYVLVILFMKYISDKAKAKEDTFLLEIPKGASFDDMVKLKWHVDIGDKINKILTAVAEHNNLNGVINVADFNNDAKLGKGKDLVDTVSGLIAAFEKPELDFSKNRAADDDLIGDAYEYLMKNFATESGKSKGQFYTPAEVSRLIAKLISINKDNRDGLSVYDPTCGSGSLLLKVFNEVSHSKNVGLYGQEKDINNVGMAKMNMIIHGNETSDIKQGNTLTDPKFFKEDNSTELRTFDYVVANPPFSQKKWLKGAKENDEFGRWGYDAIGLPPKECGDYAFLLHIVRSLKSSGKGACILPHGVLFRGNAEKKIRTNLIKRGYIKGIIGLPPNLFYGTGIPACIIVLDKKESSNRKGVFMIDAKQGFKKDGNKNRLREQDIRRIVDVWEDFKDVEHYAHFATNEEIKKNDYNLNVPRYIKTKDDEIVQDIDAHLHGGIPQRDIDNLYEYWNAVPTLKNELMQHSREGFYKFIISEHQAIHDKIMENKDVKHQQQILSNSFFAWSNENKEMFEKLAQGGFNPKEKIDQMGNSMLKTFENSLFIDKYDAYDQLMNYWTAQMQDDFYLIRADGWSIDDHIIQPNDKSKTKPKKVAKTINDWICDLLPASFIVSEFFSEIQYQIDINEEELNELNAQNDEYCEENEDEYLDPNNFDKGKLNQTTAKKKLKEAKGEEKEVIEKYLDYAKKISDKKRDINKLKSEQLCKVQLKYEELKKDTEQTKHLVIKKWDTAIEKGLQSEMQCTIEQLTTSLYEIQERYLQTLSQISAEIEQCEHKVMQHLAQMGFTL